MDAEEWKSRVGDRVDEPADEMPTLGPQTQVVTPERHDPRLLRRARESGQPVRVDAAADDDALRLQVAGGRLDHGRASAP
jgi:hypothetical protein